MHSNADLRHLPVAARCRIIPFIHETCRWTAIHGHWEIGCDVMHRNLTGTGNSSRWVFRGNGQRRNKKSPRGQITVGSVYPRFHKMSLPEPAALVVRNQGSSTTCKAIAPDWQCASIQSPLPIENKTMYSNLRYAPSRLTSAIVTVTVLFTAPVPPGFARS